MSYQKYTQPSLLWRKKVKKLFSIFTLTIFCITLPLVSNPTVSSTSPLIETHPEILSPEPSTEQSSPEPDSDVYKFSFKKNKTAAAIVIGTIATAAIGLFLSGTNQGKHAPSKTAKAK